MTVVALEGVMCTYKSTVLEALQSAEGVVCLPELLLEESEPGHGSPQTQLLNYYFENDRQKSRQIAAARLRGQAVLLDRYYVSTASYHLSLFHGAPHEYARERELVEKEIRHLEKPDVWVHLHRSAVGSVLRARQFRPGKLHGQWATVAGVRRLQKESLMLLKREAKAVRVRLFPAYDEACLAKIVEAVRSLLFEPRFLAQR
jgi:thymidylate kinase